MKKTAYFWLVLLTFAVMACGGAKGKIVGKWKVDAVNGKSPSTEMTMEMKSDGTFAQSKKKAGKNESSTRGGKWEVDKEGKKITLTPDGEKSEVAEILKLDGKEFTFKDSKNEFRLSKQK
jgi:hypothetical protein